MNSFSRGLAMLMATSFYSTTTLGQTVFSQSRQRRRVGDSNSLSNSPEREMQEGGSVFIHFTEGTSYPAPTPSPTSTPYKRTPNYLSCNRQNAGNTNVVLLDVRYDVETDVEELSVELEQKMLKSLSGAMTASVFDSHCVARLLGESSRKLELESIDSGQLDIPLEPCSMGTDSKGCMRYDGDLLLGYSDVGEVSTAYAVGEIVMDQIRNDMENGIYIETLNDDLFGSGVSVTRVNYVGSNYFQRHAEQTAPPEQTISSIQTSNFTVDEGGLNGLGKFMVAFVVLLFLLAICACACLVRTQARKEEARQEEQEEKREIATIVTDEGQDIDHDESILYSDYLGLPANKNLDVHRCISSECDVCERNLAPFPTPVSSVGSHKSRVSNLTVEDYNEVTEIKPSETGSRPVRRINPDGTVDNIFQMRSNKKPKKNVRFPSNQDVLRRCQVVDDTGVLREEVEL